MSELAVVTGASGFVGSAVARAAARRGHRVRVLVRPSSPRRNLDPAFEVVEGDMRAPATLGNAFEGARFVFHVAADYRLWSRDPVEILVNNLEGTRAIMDAAQKAGAEKIVYTSSVAALKPLKDRAADETSRHTEASAIGAYKRSKVAAERLVEVMIEKGLPAVIVAPSTPIGPRDIKPTPTGRIIVEAARGRMPAFVDTGLNLVHVDDVAEGHLLALERGKIGESYILGGEDVLLRQMLEAIAQLAGRKPPRLRLPRRPLFPLAFAAEALARISGREPFLSADALRMAGHRMFFSSDKARRELGYTTRPY
ncbi:MAG: NAD-dependent epimerase/dehydratase family protein, partial [Alphaproteobacteria bacterium]|nr:NAD-dependent epimerase/dehydratase family protein [Alphaproteobacteria bacterium]